MIVDAPAGGQPDVIHECREARWPGAMEQALRALPKRWVFRNERVSALLIGFNRVDALVLGPWPQACLIVVTFGGLDAETGAGRFCLKETDSLVIPPGVRHELSTMGGADFLLMNLTLPTPTSSRCLCQGTPGRGELLAAAARLVPVHRQT